MGWNWELVTGICLGAEIPDKPCGGGPEPERGDDRDEAELDESEKNQKRKQGQERTRAGDIRAVHQGRNGKALIVEVAVGRGQKANEDEDACVAGPVPGAAAAPIVPWLPPP